MSDIIQRGPYEETYVRGGKPVRRARHDNQSPLQRQRNQCLSEQLTGKHFPNRTAQRAAFGQAVSFCAKKYPKH